MGLVTASSVKYDLRPLDRVVGYYIYDTMEQDVTSIRDLLVDEETREPRYAIVEIGGMMSIKGKKILIPWGALAKGGMSRMDINSSEEEILAAPAPMDPLAPTEAEEETIHRFFKVEPYWLDEVPPEKGETEKEDSAPEPRPAPPGDEPITGLEMENDDEK